MEERRQGLDQIEIPEIPQKQNVPVLFVHIQQKENEFIEGFSVYSSYELLLSLKLFLNPLGVQVEFENGDWLMGIIFTQNTQDCVRIKVGVVDYYNSIVLDGLYEENPTVNTKSENQINYLEFKVSPSQFEIVPVDEKDFPPLPNHDNNFPSIENSIKKNLVWSEGGQYLFVWSLLSNRVEWYRLNTENKTLHCLPSFFFSHNERVEKLCTSQDDSRVAFIFSTTNSEAISNPLIFDISNPYSAEALVVDPIFNNPENSATHQNNEIANLMFSPDGHIFSYVVKNHFQNENAISYFKYNPNQHRYERSATKQVDYWHSTGIALNHGGYVFHFIANLFSLFVYEDDQLKPVFKDKQLGQYGNVEKIIKIEENRFLLASPDSYLFELNLKDEENPIFSNIEITEYLIEVGVPRSASFSLENNTINYIGLDYKKRLLCGNLNAQTTYIMNENVPFDYFMPPVQHPTINGLMAMPKTSFFNANKDINIFNVDYSLGVMENENYQITPLISG